MKEAMHFDFLITVKDSVKDSVLTKGREKMMINQGTLIVPGREIYFFRDLPWRI